MHGDESGFDPTTYGRSFAEVYDEWYPADTQTDAAVRRIAGLCPAGGSVLELGVGTGRLALPLAASGLAVTGFDASAEMLAALAAKPDGDRVRVVLGDVGAPGDWPQGPFDVVLAACNLVFNLADEGEQRRCIEAAANVLTPTGRLVVEAFVPAPIERRERRLEVKEVTATGVVLIATDADPGSGAVTGQHIELNDGEPVRLRPWRIRVADPAALDRYASDVGLVALERHADWARTPFDADSAAHVTVYGRPD